MSTIDNRIVQMQFNNKQFEDSIKTSTKSLDNLKKGLQLDESANSLSNLSKVGKAFTLEGISNGVEALNNKFSAMGIVGITALQNIANSAINAGKTLIESLTVDPIKDGLNEYETKMDAIQTILTNTASKGTTLSQVNDALNELNKYSDLTIYNFAQMTDNIGKMTAAGLGLKDSVTVVKGLANTAAGFGVDATKMAGATYQMSQALSAGSIKLMDWKSMEQAGMGGEKLQKVLIDLGKTQGKITTEMQNGQEKIVTYTKKNGKELLNFRDSLKSGWLDTDVFVKAMDKMANDKSLLLAAENVTSLTKLIGTMKEAVGSGWAQSWESIFGNKDQSTKLFTDINNAFNSLIAPSTNARNAVLAFWNANGGREAIIKGLSNSFNGLMEILTPISAAFRTIFPAVTGKQLVDISKKFERVTEHFKIGVPTIINIRKTFEGLFSILSIGVKVIELAVGIIGLLIKILIPGTNGILGLTGAIGGLITGLDNFIEKSDLVNRATKKIGEAFTVVKDVINKVVTYMQPGVNAIIDNLTKEFIYLKPYFVSVFNDIGNTLVYVEPIIAKGITKIIKSLSKLKPEITFIKELLSELAEKFMSLFGDTKVYASGFDDIGKSVDKAANPIKTFKKLIEGICVVFFVIKKVITTVFKGILDFITPIFTSLKSQLGHLSLQDIGSILTGLGLLTIAKTIKDGLGGINEVLEQLGNTLKAFQLKVKAEALLKIAIALGILAVALIALSYLDAKDLAKSLITLTIVFTELIVGLIILNKNVTTVRKITTQMVALGLGMLLLAYAVKTLSSIDSSKLKNSILALAALMGILALFINLTRGANLKKSAGGLVTFSLGILILTGALSILGKMKTSQLEQGVIALTALMTVIALFVDLTKGGSLKSSAGGLIAFSLGILILTGALSILGKMKVGTLEQGIVALTALMTVIALFVDLTKGGDLAKSSGGLIGFAIGLVILTGALSILGKMKVGQLVQGVIAITTLMTVIGLFVNLTNGGDLAKSSGGLIGFAIGLLILTKSLSILGKMKANQLIQGTVALSALMIVIGLFVNLTKGGDLAKSAKGLTGFSIGLLILTGAVAILASLKPEKLIMGVEALVALIGSIVLFVTLTNGGDLEKSAKGMIGFSTGILILAGVLAILAGLNSGKLILASVALSTIITVIGLYVKMANGGNIIKAAIGLVVISGSIIVLAEALKLVSTLDTDKLVLSALAITSLLLSIVLITKLTKPGELILTAGALVIFSGALVIMAKALSILGSVDSKTLVIGISSLIAMLLVLGASASILGPLTPVIISLSIAMVAFGIACLAMGAGMWLLAKSLEAFNASGEAGSKILFKIVMNLIDLIPLAMAKLGDGITVFIKSLGDNAPIIADSCSKMLNALLAIIVQSIPALANAGLQLILALLTGIANNTQQIVEAGMNIIINLIIGITNKLPDIIDAAFKLIVSFIDGLATAIDKNHDAINNACVHLINSIVDAIGDLIGDLVNVGANLVRGAIQGIENTKNELFDSVHNIFSDVVTRVKKILGIKSPSRVFAEIGKYSVQGFAKGINKYSTLAENEVKNMGLNTLDTLTNAMSNISDAVNGNIDANPTIRPVMDLTEIISGAGTIYSMLNQNQGITVSANTRKTASINSNISQNQELIQNGSSQSLQQSNTNPKSVSVQLVLQNGKAIAEFMLPDLDNLTGENNKIIGRMVGLR